MKIFYAVQATGNGHISRAMQLMPYLKKFGEIDVFLSGSNATLNCALPVKYTSKGMSLFYSRCGGLDYKKIWKENSLYRAKKEALTLPIEQYDIIINDFEYITAQSCKIKNIPSVQFGHQASFLSAHTPRPENKSIIGEMVLKHYAPATNYIGLHFQQYDDFIFPPVIKDIFIECAPRDKGHITVYLPAYQQHCIEHHLRSISDQHFHWFLHGIKEVQRIGNITYYPINNDLFNESLINCNGIITGGGFETPAEALYLGKRLMSIPIRSQYEQQCNAAALSKMGITVLADADTTHFASDIKAWLTEDKPLVQQAANNIRQTLEFLLDTYPTSVNYMAQAV
jgi:uncharacterized protein (TIGR00661 family)